MGQEIDKQRFTSKDFRCFNERLKQETELLQAWFDDQRFSHNGLVAGYELEAWLLDHQGNPKTCNQAFLDAMNSDLISPELAQFNVEFNIAPHELSHSFFSDYAQALHQQWSDATRVAETLDCRLLSIGILPSLTPEHLTMKNVSAMERYRALNEQVLRQRRGKAFELNINGHEAIHSVHRDVMLESAATSMQLHLQVNQQQAVSYYNAAIALSAISVGVSTNSPYLFGKDVWAETRIPVFEQAVNVGGYEAASQGPIHRVSFGTDYARHSLMEPFIENRNHFPPLLPVHFDDDPAAMKHVALHNGTIWRWNRPLIGFDEDGTPHLRIEHRVMASGPSIEDNLANMALYYGLVHVYAQRHEELVEQLEFAAARDNFYQAARLGLGVHLNWPGCHRCTLKNLLLNRLLDEAETGLQQLGMEATDIERYLGIIQARVETGQTGSEWQRQFVQRHDADMQQLCLSYFKHQQTGKPVHEWDFDPMF